MHILLTGATGLVGNEIGKKLVEAGHTVTALTRNKLRAKGELAFPARLIEWNYEREEFPVHVLQSIDVVINLAGESIANKRWNSKTKQEIFNSRVLFTQKIVQGIQKSNNDKDCKIRSFISASAVGIYPDSTEVSYKEGDETGKSFLSQVCSNWEEASHPLKDMGIRVCSVRIGIVLSPQGGALAKLIPLFSSGLGSIIGKGKQWMSWIHIEDLSRLFLHILENDKIVGAVNGVAPEPVTNKIFSRELAQNLQRGLFFPVPSFVLKLALGEMSAIILESQKVLSYKTEESGFKFHYPSLPLALKNLCSGFENGKKELLVEQWVPESADKIFPFFCDEMNLEKLTPDFLGFKVLRKSTAVMQEGTLIDYKLSLHGLPMKWKTRIEEWQPDEKFVDTQLKGPYKLWHHTHYFIPFAGGTLLRDRVWFKLPLGRLGDLVSYPFVRKDIEKIFKFRRKAIASLYYHE